MESATEFTRQLEHFAELFGVSTLILIIVLVILLAMVITVLLVTWKIVVPFLNHWLPKFHDTLDGISTALETSAQASKLNDDLHREHLNALIQIQADNRSGFRILRQGQVEAQTSRDAIRTEILNAANLHSERVLAVLRDVRKDLADEQRSIQETAQKLDTIYQWVLSEQAKGDAA